MGAVGLRHTSKAAQGTVALAEMGKGALGVGGAQLPPLFLGRLGQGVGTIRWISVELAQALAAVVKAAGGAVVLGGPTLGAELTGCWARTQGHWQGAWCRATEGMEGAEVGRATLETAQFRVGIQ